MGMNLGGGGGVKAEPNVTPMIDVMLVLLIMLIVTIPVQLHAVDLAMPVGAIAPAERVGAVRVDVDASGRVLWQGVALADEQTLEARLRDLAARSPAPELQLRADARARYAVVAGVLAATRRHGLAQVTMLGDEQFD